MPVEVPIAQLARKLGVSPEEILGTLESLGQREYRSRLASVPLDLARRVQEALAARGRTAGLQPASPDEEMARAMGTRAPGSNDLFEKAMSVAGVRPIHAPAPKPPKKPTSPRPPQAKRTLPPQQARVPVPGPGPTPVPPVPVAPPPAPAAPVVVALPPPPDPRVPELERALGGVRTELVTAFARVESLEAENRALREALDARRSPVPGVASWLEQRGLVEADERRRGLAGLILAGALDEPMGTWPAPSAGPELRLCLTCGRPGCEVPADLVAVGVPAGRCELCAGHTAQRLFRRVDDACLLSGHVRILWFGGSEPVLRWVRERLDRRIQTRMYASAQGPSPERWAEDLRWASVVVAWGASIDLPSHVPAVVEPSRTVGRVLAALAARIDDIPIPHPPAQGGGEQAAE